nr:outer membrane protein assembly factor BamE [Myxococcus sp. CA040A]
MAKGASGGRRLGCVAVGVVVVLSAVVLVRAFLLDGVSGALLACIVGEDTVYSARYSDRGFRTILPGMSEEQVRHALGEPLRVQELDPPYGAVWSYSKSAKKDNYRIRTVRFGEDGKVVTKTAEFWLD